jgi:hypothetical protein
VIYRVAPGENNAKVIQIIAVGPRANLRVYRDAAERLGRTPGTDAPAE